MAEKEDEKAHQGNPLEGKTTAHSFVNGRDEKMFVRVMATEAKSPRALVVFFHALGDHSAAPGVLEYWHRLAQAGFAVAGYDMEGHGRSAQPGDPLSLIKDYKHLIDDGVSFVKAIYDPKADFGPKEAKLPFFVSGISTGGMVAINVAIELEKKKRKDEGALWKNFQGAVLFAPVIYQTLEPNWFETTALKTLKAIGFAKAGLGPKPDPKAFPTKESYKLICADPLCYYGGMLLNTGTSLLSMTHVTQGALDDVEYPFTVFHGHSDPIVPYHGSETLIKRAKTGDADKQIKGYDKLDDTEQVKQLVDDALAWIDLRLHSKK